MKTLAPITDAAKLDELGLPYPETVLAERFLLPIESLQWFNISVPTTIGEIAEASGMPLSEVIKIVSDCIEQAKDLALPGTAAAFLAEEDAWVVDMRPMVTYESDPLLQGARMFHLGNPAAQIAHMRTLARVIVISDSPAHAWSAAMGLRGMGVKAYVTTFPASEKTSYVI